jgi:hypothetical protein
VTPRERAEAVVGPPEFRVGTYGYTKWEARVVAVETAIVAAQRAAYEAAARLVASERHEVAANAGWSEPDFDPRPEVVELLEYVEKSIRALAGKAAT